ncbi:hypothetical protein GGR56DRAFT_675678 [Xylariaceae sp. FL0804]|nr:hypothetical protein GGR56DRAFT_675678 [Xylariaceae sp. FL0804]
MRFTNVLAVLLTAAPIMVRGLPVLGAGGDPPAANNASATANASIRNVQDELAECLRHDNKPHCIEQAIRALEAVYAAANATAAADGGEEKGRLAAAAVVPGDDAALEVFLPAESGSVAATVTATAAAAADDDDAGETAVWGNVNTTVSDHFGCVDHPMCDLRQCKRCIGCGNFWFNPCDPICRAGGDPCAGCCLQPMD